MTNESITATLLLVFLVFVLPRKYFLAPYIMAACIIPADQRIMIFDLDFTPLRILVLCGALKLFAYSTIREIRWNSFDKLIFAWMISGTIIYVIQWHTFSAVIYKSGVLFDCIGLYWIFRQTLTSWNDVFFTIKLFAFFAIISAPLMIYERVTHDSIFLLLGRAPASMHRGRYRCAGPFPHFIIMGLFWANLLPLFYACIRANVGKLFYYTAIIAALTCVVLSGSSTPIMTLITIGGFWLLYKYRMYGKQIWIGILCTLLALHIVMKAPAWHLISRVNVFGGSTGWHRFHLFDRFLRHAGEWFFLGTKNTAHWGAGLQDITNQFVLEAVRGGFVTLAIFVAIIYQSVKLTGQYSLNSPNEKLKWLSWGLCVSILGHSVSFWGVSYFGQIMMLLYLTFAMVGFVSETQGNKNMSRHVIVLESS